jgi:DNA polymerase
LIVNPSKDIRQEALEILSSLKSYFESRKLSGINCFYLDPADTSGTANHAELQTGVEQKRVRLKEVQEELGDCRRCKLHAKRKNIVFGEGSPAARLMFVGEAPGADEDMQGRPFVGKAGQLLTRIINAIDLERSDVYIANIIKCRPPSNRDPEEDEIQTCIPFLKKQLEIIQPRIICALGRLAAQALLETDRGITELRGRFQMFGDSKVMPIYHPSYLLRNPARKKETWLDMQVVQKEYFQGPKD